MSVTARQLSGQPDTRPMQITDLQAIIAIENRAYQFPWSHDVFMTCFGEGYAGWVLQLEQRLIGYAVVYLAAGDCHLVNLCIDPPFQKQGFGRDLLTSTLDYARAYGARRALLEVRVSDAAAYALYASENFVRLSLRRNYYPTANGREDAVVMTKQL